MRSALLLCLSVGLFVGCAHTTALPQELVDARAAYNRAAQSPGAEMAQAELQLARAKLHRAEEAYLQAPGAPETIDLAYIAQRRAQLAESVASTALARGQQERAEHAVKALRERLMVEAQNAAHLREQVAKEQNAAREALNQLSHLKHGVRQDTRGLVVTLPNQALFAAHKVMLSAQGRQQLDSLAKILRGTVKAQSITIEGYSDGQGSSERDELLTQHRAQAVLDYLARRGVPAERLQAIGRGASRPIASNHTTEGRAANRRVEVVVQSEASAAR